MKIRPTIQAVLGLCMFAMLGQVHAGHTGGSQVVSTDLTTGNGTEAVQHATVSVHYTGWLEDGTQFDSSVDRGTPFKFTLGAGQVIPGWDQGVVGMRVGGKRVLVIPPELGYGASGSGGVIPPNATLKFEIELLGVEPPPYANLDNARLEAMLAEGAKLVDIRRPDEWKQTGVIEGSILLTAFDGNGRFVNSFPEELEKLVGKDESVILICRTGNRSSVLANAMGARADYAQMFNVTDGIVRWIGDGRPVSKQF